MKFVTRKEWGARYAQGSARIPGPVYGVTLHWEGPHMGDWHHGECAGKVRVIERFHAVTRGWAGIAYNLIVCPHGYVFEGRGAGIRSAANGTSGIGGNDHWYAVCYLGGQGDGFTPAGQHGMADAITYLRSKGAGPKVNGHRDHHPTECPGDEIYAWTKHPIEGDDDVTNDDIQKIADAVADRVEARILDTDLNANEPKGEAKFRGVTLRMAIKEIIEATGAKVEGRAK